MNKRIFALALVIALALSLISVGAMPEYGAELNPNEKTYAQRFSDVPEGHWAFQYVGELVERGAINGYPDGKFYPDKIVTREEFAKIMVVAAGLTATPVDYSSYSDVEATYWASPFIETAKPYMTAYQDAWGGTSFHPKDGALREDIAVAVVKLKGYDTRLADLSIIQTMFSDVEGISAAAQPYVALAVENGIISGYTDGTFKGQATITRSEAAAMLWRAFQYGNDNKVIAAETTPAPSAKPTASAKPTETAKASATPKPSATPMPTATPEPAKPFVAETVVKNVNISDTRMMMTMDDDSNLIFYNAKSNKIVSLDPDTDKTTTLLDVARATIEVPVAAQTAGLSALDDEEVGEPPATEADEPETEEEPTPEEPAAPSVITYEDLTVRQVFWDNMAGRLLVWGKFASIQNSADEGWTLPDQSDKGLEGVFTLENGELSYFSGMKTSSEVSYNHYPRRIECALSNGTFVVGTVYKSGDYPEYVEICDLEIVKAITKVDSANYWTMIFQNGSDIYKVNDGLGKYNYGTGNVGFVSGNIGSLARCYSNDKIYSWKPELIKVVRPSDGAEQAKLNPSTDVDIKDLQPLPGEPDNLWVTSDEQYLFYDSSSNAIRVIRPNPAA